MRTQEASAFLHGVLLGCWACGPCPALAAVLGFTGLRGTFLLAPRAPSPALPGPSSCSVLCLLPPSMPQPDTLSTLPAFVTSSHSVSGGSAGLLGLVKRPVTLPVLALVISWCPCLSTSLQSRLPGICGLPFLSPHGPPAEFVLLLHKHDRNVPYPEVRPDSAAITGSPAPAASRTPPQAPRQLLRVTGSFPSSLPLPRELHRMSRVVTGSHGPRSVDVT